MGGMLTSRSLAPLACALALAVAGCAQVQPAPARVFVTHGDMGASDALRQRIEHGLRWRAQVPRAGASYTV